MTVIKEVLKVVPLEQVQMTIRCKVDRRCYPGNAPLTSWKDPAFLKAVAADFCRSLMVPGLVKEWLAAADVQRGPFGRLVRPEPAPSAAPDAS
jgi:hypothetical protein